MSNYPAQDRSSRYAVFVVAKDFIICQIGLPRQRIDTLENFINFLALSRGPLPPGKPLQAFFQGDPDRLRNGLTRSFSDFPRKLIGGVVFNVQSHTDYILHSSFFLANGINNPAKRQRASVIKSGIYCWQEKGSSSCWPT